MALADVYCRVNRARGLELLSPEDLLNACKLLSGPMTLKQFPSGSMVIQLENHNEEAIVAKIREEIDKTETLNDSELARILNVSLLLAQEHLLIAEREGVLCRDESIEGLRFYPNLFLQRIES